MPRPKLPCTRQRCPGFAARRPASGASTAAVPCVPRPCLAVPCRAAVWPALLLPSPCPACNAARVAVPSVAATAARFTRRIRLYSQRPHCPPSRVWPVLPRPRHVQPAAPHCPLVPSHLLYVSNPQHRTAPRPESGLCCYCRYMSNLSLHAAPHRPPVPGLACIATGAPVFKLCFCTQYCPVYCRPVSCLAPTRNTCCLYSLPAVPPSSL